MSAFANLVTNTYNVLLERDEDPTNTVTMPVDDAPPAPEVKSGLETSALPDKMDPTVKVQLMKLAVAALFVDKDRLEESNPSARTIINELSNLTPIDITNVEQSQKLLEELLALIQMPS